MKKLSTLALAVISASTALTTHANNRLEEMVISSSRIEKPLREIATSVSVITAEDIKIRGFQSAADLLRYDPGISVTNNGGVGKATSLGIRGERGFRTNVYIDGIDVTDTSTPQAGPNFANLMGAGIERIEVLRGPQGMMYGADAGGVVVINTIAAQEGLHGSAKGEWGRYGTSDYEGHLTGGNEAVDFTVIAAHYETDGFNTLATDTDLQDDDGYEADTFHGRFGWNITDTLRAEVVGRHVEGDNDYDDCFTVDTFAPTNNCTNEYEQDAYRAALSHEGEQFSNSIAYSGNQTEREFFSEGQSSFYSEGELEKIEYLGSWQAREGMSFVYGAELENDSIESSGDDIDRDEEGYYLEYQGSFSDAIFVTAGARYTDNDDFGSETTYRASAAYLMDIGDGELKFKGVYGTGYRAPSLSELAYNSGPNAFPPASLVELTAEESEGYDLGIGYFADAGWFVDVVYFNQEIDDEIYFDLIDFSGYLQDGDSSSEGVEVDSEYIVNDMFTLSGNYTYNDTEDDAGEQRIRAPEHMANLGLRITPLEGLEINLNYRISRDRADEQGVEVDDYEVLDLSANYHVTDNFEVFGRVENATDEDYEEVPNYNTSGAAGYAGVRYSF